MIIKSRQELQIIKDNYKDRVLRRSSDQGVSDRIDILVGMSTCGIAAGAQIVYETLLKKVLDLNNANIKVIPVGCMGYCHSEPTIVVCASKKQPTIYGRVDAKIANKIVEEHILLNQIVETNVLIMEFNNHLDEVQS